MLSIAWISFEAEHQINYKTIMNSHNQVQSPHANFQFSIDTITSLFRAKKIVQINIKINFDPME